jgi:sigma-54 dependent transcriptional regulator, acetoin dehydrogenase operon transcriptional activator AcoR
MSTSDENDISRTVPRRGLPREVPHVGVVIVIGAGDALGTLGKPRIVAMDQLTLHIGRRAHPMPVPGTGGAATASLAIPDPTVSGIHARIQRASSGADLFIVQDLGSTNGTYVDGKRMTGPAPLRDGAVLFLGSQVLVFRIVTAAELEAIQEDAAAPFGPLPTCSPTLAVTCAKLRRLARTPSEILLVGETGVGKEVFANAIHAHSGRAGKMVAINCAAIPRELVESELFGYERGAHSTAQGRKVGLVEAADGGTLFLDEIGDMPSELQSKLLRFLQDRRFTPLGSTRVVEADVRIVAATSRISLDKGPQPQVQDAVLGRLGAQPILLPPLRDRVEDVGRLVTHFLSGMNDGRVFEPEAFHALCLHAWPLNVRELSKVMAEAEALSRGGATIGLEHLPDPVTATLQLDAEDEFENTDVDLQPPPPAEDDTVESDPGMTRAAGVPTRTRRRRPAPSREELTSLLGATNGSVAEVARRLNRQYAVVWRCIQRYGIDANQFRNGNG